MLARITKADFGVYRQRTASGSTYRVDLRQALPCSDRPRRGRCLPGVLGRRAPGRDPHVTCTRRFVPGNVSPRPGPQVPMPRWAPPATSRVTPVM